MKDRPNMESLWKSTRRSLFIVAFGIILYEILENLTAVRSALGGFVSIVTPVFIGIAIAFIANMPMHFLETKVFRRWKDCGAKRGTCLVLAMLFVFAIIITLVLVVGPQLVESIKTLAADFTQYATSLTEWATNVWESLNFNQEVEAKLMEMGNNILTEIYQYISTVSSAAVKFTMGLAGVLVDLAFAFIISIYCLAGKETLIRQSRKFCKAVFNERTADYIIHVGDETNTSLHNYVYGMLTECFILGGMCFIGMSIFKFPFALLISVLVGLGQMIPIVGAWVSAGIGAVILFVVDPPSALWFILLICTIQPIEGNLIYPHVVGNAVGISPLWVLIALLLGGGLFGFLGALLCVPIMAVIHTMTREWVNKRLEEKRAAGQEI
ncbi:MAG: AI-2E family transporter [Clostridia bacterium]|nr:AI-2E family transporter [Clostridia bacterium]